MLCISLGQCPCDTFQQASLRRRTHICCSWVSRFQMQNMLIIHCMVSCVCSSGEPRSLDLLWSFPTTTWRSFRWQELGPLSTLWNYAVISNLYQTWLYRSRILFTTDDDDSLLIVFSLLTIVMMMLLMLRHQWYIDVESLMVCWCFSCRVIDGILMCLMSGH